MKRGRAEGGWTLLENVRWLQRDGIDVYLPAVGTASQIRSSITGLSDATASDDIVKNLLNGKTKTWPEGWSCLPKG